MKSSPIDRWLLAALLACAPAVCLAQSISRPGSSTHPPVHSRAWSANVVLPQSRAFNPHLAAPAAVQIVEVRVGVVVLEQVATTTMDIRLRNPAGGLQQAELLVPVPDGAVVRGFDFLGKAAEPTAELLPKDEARRIYNGIVARVRDPALLEFAGFNLIRSSVFPVPARGEQQVRLTYEHLLPADGNRVDYLLPRSESLDYRVPWSISLKIRAKRPIATVYSPSHEIETVRRAEGELRVRVVNAGDTPGPFRMSYLVHQEGLSASLFAYPDPKTGGGYFLFFAGLPPRAEANRKKPAIKREVTLVIDRSGSMNGEKIRQVRSAALQVLAGLDPGEAFNLIVYNEAVDPFSEKPVIKTDKNMAAARAWLAGVRSRGGTNIHDALFEALRPAPTKGMLPIVLFLTDGLPTIGQTSERAIRRMVTRSNKAGRRIFTFGVGVDVNTPLLDKIASSSRAFATFVLPGEDVEVKVSKVFRGLSGPILADTRLRVLDRDKNPARGRVRELLPARPPDLFEGDQLVLLGQYLGQGHLTFELSGNFLGRRRTFRSRVDLSRATTRNAFVPRLWASRKIADLVDAIRASGADADRAAFGKGRAVDPRFSELVEEIVKLSLEFGVLTEYTAFLAREGTDLGRRDEVMARAKANFQTRAVQTRSGLSSVNQEFNRQAQARQMVLNPTNAYYDANMNRVAVTSVQQVADRAFFRRGRQWVDSRLVESRARPAREIRFGSDEFWKLVDRLVREGRQGSIAFRGDVLLEVDGKPVLIRNSATP